MLNSNAARRYRRQVTQKSLIFTISPLIAWYLYCRTNHPILAQAVCSETRGGFCSQGIVIPRSLPNISVNLDLGRRKLPANILICLSIRSSRSAPIGLKERNHEPFPLLPSPSPLADSCLNESVELTLFSTINPRPILQTTGRSIPVPVKYK